VVQFGIAGLIALIVVGVATQFASRRAGERSAVDQARSTALLRAQVVSRYVTPKLLVGDPGAIDRLDRVVTRSVLDRSIVRVKIWTSDGTILYSDEKRLIGRRFALGQDEIEVVRSDRRVVAGVSNLSNPENQFERRDRKLLEVYTPMRPFPGERLLFEAYFRYDAVSSAGARLYQNSAPWTIGALIVLQLVQLPLAWSLARRLQRRQRESERILRQALEATTVERRRSPSVGSLADRTSTPMWPSSCPARNTNSVTASRHSARSWSRSIHRTSSRKDSRRPWMTSSPGCAPVV